MRNQINIKPVNSRDKDVIKDLLESEKLPVEDLPVDLQNFFIATNNDLVIGVIGLEVYQKEGLLRSLVVKPGYRKMNIAAELINEVEELGKRIGLKSIYLLTETAEGYFAGKGYTSVERKEAPASLQHSSEFSHVCPASAVLMKKIL